MKRISLLIALLLTALILLSSCGKEEKLRYNVESVKFVSSDTPLPFKHSLTNSEINEFLDALTAIDLSQYEVCLGQIEVGDGGGLTCYIETDTEIWDISFNYPYIFIGGARNLGEDHEFFKVLNRIFNNHANEAMKSCDK